MNVRVANLESTGLKTLSGHRVIVSENDGMSSTELSIVGHDGTVVLTVELTAQGLTLRFEQADVKLKNQGAVSFDCEQFRVRAESVDIESLGNIRSLAHGNHEMAAGDTAKVIGHAVSVVSRRGDVSVKANDDVRIDGERIWLNR